MVMRGSLQIKPSSVESAFSCTDSCDYRTFIAVHYGDWFISRLVSPHCTRSGGHT
jgi:hypothetical protein